MTPINNLPPTQKRKAIKIYLDAFRRQETPCPRCVYHCCTDCYWTKGYQGFINEPEKVNVQRINALKEAYGWTERDSKNPYGSQGFFIAGKGCRLPYKERSPICLTFTCNKMNEGQRHAGTELYKALMFSVKK